VTGVVFDGEVEDGVGGGVGEWELGILDLEFRIWRKRPMTGDGGLGWLWLEMI